MLQLRTSIYIPLVIKKLAGDKRNICFHMKSEHNIAVRCCVGLPHINVYYWSSVEFCTKHQFREGHTLKRASEQPCIIIQWPCIKIKRHLNCVGSLQEFLGLNKYLPLVRALMWYFAKRSQIKNICAVVISYVWSITETWFTCSRCSCEMYPKEINHIWKLHMWNYDHISRLLMCLLTRY